MLLALAFAAICFALAPPGSLGPTWLLIALGIIALAWVMLGPTDVDRDNTLPALAVILSALGLLEVARLAPELAQRQSIWLALSLILAVALGPAFTRFRVLAAYKYIWILVAVALFAALAIFGQEVNGARLWIRFGAVQFEPVEVIKLLVVLFMASYLAETADVIARTRPWSLRANAKYLGPLFIGWGASMAILIFEHDLGMATLLLATFAAMLYVATRRIDLIVGGLAVFGVLAYLAATRYSYVRTRIAVWQHPFADPFGAGYQAMQSLFSLASGGVFGTGYPQCRDRLYLRRMERRVGRGGGDRAVSGVPGDRATQLAHRAATARSLCEVTGDGARRDARLSSLHHHRRRLGRVSAHRHHTTVLFLRRQFTRHELPPHRAGLGDFERTPERPQSRCPLGFAAGSASEERAKERVDAGDRAAVAFAAIGRHDFVGRSPVAPAAQGFGNRRGGWIRGIFGRHMFHIGENRFRFTRARHVVWLAPPRGDRFARMIECASWLRFP